MDQAPLPEQRPPSALLLELCGVLYDDSCWRRWMLQLLMRLGVRTHYTAFFQVWEQEHFGRVCSGQAGYWEAMREFLRSAGLPRGRVDEAIAAGQWRRRQWERVIRPLPTVCSTLARLAGQGTPLSVIAHASFSLSTAKAKLAELKLDGLLNRDILATADLGREGHFERRFELAAERLGLPPEDVCYVGCGRVPLEAAATAGLQCLAFNTGLTTLACRSLSSFAELADQPFSPAQPRLRRAG